MPTQVNATCSECFLMQRIELNPRRKEIACAFCSHSVPMFQKPDMDAITKSQGQERTKTLIALGLFVGFVFFFGLYVYGNSREDLVVVASSPEWPDSGEVKYRGNLVEIRRDVSSIVIEDPDTGDESKQLFFKSILEDEIKQVRTDNPLMTEEEAARRAGELYVKTESPKPFPMSGVLLAVAVLAALGGIVFSAIATQDRLVCEF